MAKQSKKQARAAQRQQEAAIKLCALGGGFVIAPAFLGKTPLGSALGALIPVGLPMLIIGGFLLWLARRQAPSTESLKNPPSIAPLANRTQTQRVEPRIVDPGSRSPQISPESPPSSKPAQPIKPTSWSVEVFDVIEWRRLEALVEALFQQAGFETKSQSHGADDGVDIWLYSRNMPGQPVSIVQCKHWNGKKVGVDKLRELRGVMASLKVLRGQFVTTSSYTADAITFARENSINPLDSAGLLTLIGKRTPEQQAALLEVALDGDYWRPTCVNCGTKMVGRTPRGGGKDFWGCTSFPKCKTTMPMRRA